jgi:hypothetical protein
MLNFTNDVLDRKFVNFNPVKDFIEDLLTKKFGVNNTNLLNIFKLIDWLNSKKDSSTSEEIEKYFYEFLNYGNFNLMNLNIEKIKLVLLFLKNFNKADVTGILRFLRDLQLTKEYVYIFSRYIWITTLNKNLVQPQSMDLKLRASISMLLTYPFLEILQAEIINNQPALQGVLPDIEALLTKFTINISRIPFEKIFAIVNTNFNDYSKEKLFALLKGDTFSDYITTINDNMSHFYDLISKHDLRPLVKKLQNLFYFNTKFFNDDEAAFVQSNFQPNHFIQLSIENFLTLMNFQDQIQKLVEEGFQNKKNHFNYQFIKKKIQGLLSKKKKNPLAIPNPNRKETGVKSRWDNLISSCHYLWFLKYYVLHMKKKYNGKLDDIKSYYRVIFLKLMKKFIQETMRRKEKKVVGGEVSKQEKLRQEILMKYEDMCRSLATLFIEMKFKKNLNSVFHSLVLFLQIFVFKRGRIEKLKNFAKQINVESFFELYDNIYENKTIFNRNADNILRLSINTLKNFSFYNRLNRPGTRLLRVSRGSFKDIEKFLMDLLKRNDRVYWSMNQIKWCESFIKENNQRKRISERRKINSRMKSNSNVRAFNELSPQDQVLFIQNLKALGSVKYEVIPFFESYITYDSSFYSKYDTFKIMRRMGFEMSIHRLNEIISESHDIRRFMNGNILEEQDCNLTRNEMRNCLVRVEQKIIDKVLEMKKLTTPYFFFFIFVALAISYCMNSMFDFVLLYFWTPTKTDYIFGCLPTFGILP